MNEITFGILESLADEQGIDLASAFFSIATPDQLERIYVSLVEQENIPDESWMDGDALASAGWGTDEDYGYYGEEY